METLESLLLGNDEAKLRAYVEALLEELQLQNVASVFDWAIEINRYEQDRVNGWLVLFAVHTAPPDVRARAMQRVLNDPAFRRSHLDEL